MKIRYFISITLIVIALVLSSCFSPFTGKDEYGTIFIGSPFRAVEPSSINQYEITLRGPGNQSMSRRINAGTLQGSFKVSPGEWLLEIWAYDSSQNKTGWGSKKVTVQAGKTASVTIKMALYYEVNSYSGLQTIITNSAISSYDLRIVVTAALTSDSVIPVNGNRTITISSNGSPINKGVIARMFQINGPTTLILQDITLIGNSLASNNAIILIWDVGGTGTVVLERGSVIKGNTTGSDGSAVTILNGILEMRDGSEISGNAAANGGGVCVEANGTFIMRGGEIKGNTASGNGGGVHVDSGGTFTTKTGGIIYGDESGIASTLKNVALSTGAAVYGGPFQSETTLW
jgi:hypothetical protein